MIWLGIGIGFLMGVVAGVAGICFLAQGNDALQ